MTEQTWKVPIRNLFYLISYANQWPEFTKSLSDVEEEWLTYDLLATRFNETARVLLKRGLFRDYVPTKVETSKLSGRLIMNESMPNLMIRKPLLLCETDSYSSDMILNQIMKTTLEQINENQLINETIRKQSAQLARRMGNVSSIPLSRELFLQVRFHRLNRHYKPMIHLAWLLFELKLLSHKNGQWNLFNAELTESQMNQLFERFLLGFYKTEQHLYKAKSERLSWRLDGNRSYLPEMRTDISLEHRTEKKKIIIDAKFYKHLFQERIGKFSFHSHNMYQLFTYLLHQPEDYERKGMLLYPYNGIDLYEEYHWNERTTMAFATVNLDQPWPAIRCQLLSLIGALN